MKRYEQVTGRGNDLQERPDGEWIRFDDVEKQLDVWGTVHGHNVKLVAERAELRAEVERLRADYANLQQTLANDLRAAHAESSLAAANAQITLLERERDEARRGWKDVTALSVETDARLSAANALLARWYRDYAKQSNLSRDTKAHLAAQPATAQALHHGRDECQCPICCPVQPATAPTGRPLCPRCGWVSTRESKGDEDTYARCKCWEPEGPSHLRSNRTEAEQRVLAAMAAFDEHTLRYLRERREAEDVEWDGEMRQWTNALCTAELARRGLK